MLSSLDLRQQAGVAGDLDGARPKKDALAAFNVFVSTPGASKYDNAVESLIQDRDAMLCELRADH
jgi:hypothetical protein